MRLARSVTLLLLVLLPAALLFTGCARSEKQEYIAANNEIQDEVRPEINSAGSDAAALERSIKAIEKAIGKFDKLDVPQDFTKPHGQMVEALKELRDELQELKTAKDPKKLAQLQVRVNASQEKFNEAIDQMNKDR